MNTNRIRASEIIKIINGTPEETADLLAVEEPLEIRLGYGAAKERVQKSLSVTMRTPGNDFELSIGFLFTEGIIASIDEVQSIHYCETVRPEERNNVVRVELSSDVRVNWKKLQRNFYTTSSCGVCGKSSIEAITGEGCNIIKDELTIPSEIIYSLPEKLHEHQPVFNYTGGLHASAISDINGQVIFVREDVGRHNAFDKVIGASLLKNTAEGKIIVASGRASFELVQKAARAAIPILIAVGAPSSLAVELARESGMTLIGFTKKDRYNIYTGKERVKYEA